MTRSPRVSPLLCAAILAAACGGAGTPAASATGGAPSGPNVVMDTFAFVPATLEVTKGATVTWTNKDTAGHTVTSSDGKFDSGRIAKDTTFTFTFADAGTFAYVCGIHADMTAQIVVK